MTCTMDQKATLTASVTSLESLIVKTKEALETLQAALEELTGTTVAIATTPLTAMTMNLDNGI